MQLGMIGLHEHGAEPGGLRVFQPPKIERSGLQEAVATPEPEVATR